VNRRDLLKGAAALCVTRALHAQQLTTVQRVNGQVGVVNVGGANVVVCNAPDGVVLVDSGASTGYELLATALRDFAPGKQVTALFNTHYHVDQTGNNERFTGAKIIAQDNVLQWMSNDVWLPDQDRYQKARPKAAWPTQTFLEKGTLQAGGEQIDYGYLLLAHTNGDAYVHFKTSNVLAVGGAASPAQDPELDYFTGAWIGGRVDAMDTLLALANDQTRIVPASGPIMTKAQLKAERDLMEEVRARLWTRVREGLGPDDMLKIGVLNGLPRTWKDPKKFLYDAAKGMWGHHNKLDGNVV
jgi:glyoxylase-like metal-dependent hydrolase (beta-lactamase superfamily II)